ncbi:MAG TPA: bifunctional phosphoglucose/phosphomannose isomerase [Acidimicrobiales bacterium]|nr:bifunctional phosphoglucose/phosphomannose isomerase [Acidimicrobiales bacterium]
MIGADAPLDSQGMLEAASTLPEQVATALALERGYDSLPDRDDVENVVVLGMGGSGTAGEVLMATAGPFLPVPVLVFKSYHVPAFVGEGSLVFALSFSGDTEETVEAVTEAALQGARVVAVTAGGELARLARSWGVPLIDVPLSIPQPRAAIGALAVPPMLVLEDIGLFPGASHWVEAAIEQLAARRNELVRPGSLAHELARRIGRTIPLIHGGGGLGAVAAQRWKNQMNENAKVPSFFNAHPELCHNEIAGWGQHGDLTRQAMTLVNLRHDFEHPQVMHRFELARRLLEEVMAGVEEVWAAGDGELAQLLDLVMVGDFTSIYLALESGVDPGPIPAIDHIKHELATSAGERPEPVDPEGATLA